MSDHTRSGWELGRGGTRVGPTAVGAGAEPARLRGTMISPGIAFGLARVVEPLAFTASPAHVAVSEVEDEIVRLERARDMVRDHLEEHVRGVHAPATEDLSQIFAAHLLVLDDHAFFTSMAERIRTSHLSADGAVAEAFTAAAARLADSDDCYLRSRAEDLRDICASLRRALAYGADAFAAPAVGPEPVVLVVPSLRPSLVLRARRQGVSAVVADDAALTSHGAILLRAAGIPALGGIHLDGTGIRDGTPLLVDAVGGTLIVDPADDEVRAARGRAAAEGPLANDLTLPPLDADLPSGESVELFANIDHPAQAVLCLAYRLRGVGLFRTEFLVTDRGILPDEESQFRMIREVVALLAGRPLVVRTFDFGADKDPAQGFRCLGPNPALGLRGIRRHLQRFPNEFQTQISAILRGAAGGAVSILLPMITAPDDVRAARALLTQVVEELAQRRIPFAETVRLGAMLEVPAAALQVPELLELVDFFSVGTNDLLQYLTAADRENPAVLAYQTAERSGLYRLLESVMDAARAAGRQGDLSVCGELASDPRAARQLVQLGFRSLSVTPGAAAAVRAALTRADP